MKRYLYTQKDLAPDQKSKERQSEYLHMCRKVDANDEIARDVERARADLEAVLCSPLLFVKPIFYKRNWRQYMMWEMNKDADNYIWPEYEGNRGSNKVSTCLMKFIEELPKTVGTCAI